MKRRRLLAILLTALMLLGMMPDALAMMDGQGNIIDWPDQNHVHDYSIYEPGVNNCKESYHYMYCTGCSDYIKVDDPLAPHTWARETVNKQPTCTENGEMSHVCSVCGLFETIPVAALGHAWGDWATVEEPTCTEEGLMQRVCSRCRAIEQAYVDALGHNYTNSRVTREATCAREGERQAKCSRCGRTVTESIARTPHTWGEWTVVQQPGPWTPGKEERTCSVCGAKDSRDTYMDGTVLPGERSDNAKQLQEALNEAGYDCGKADGIVGNKTTAAISAAEEASGHPATGIGWPGLMDWLQGGGVQAASDAVDSFALWVDAPMESDAKAGETIPVTVHLKNTGTTTLFVGNYTFGDFSNGSSIIATGEEDVDLSNFGAVDGIMAPGGEYTFTYNVVPTEIDVATFQAIRQIDVACCRYENGQMAGDYISRSAAFLIALGHSPTPVDYFDSFIVWADAPTQSPAQAGETIPVTVHVKNTGNTTLQVGGLSYGAYSSASGLSFIGAESFEEKDNKYDFAPGEELTYIYNVAPQEAEFLAGALTRQVSISCARLIDGQIASPFMNQDTAFTIVLGGEPITVQPNPMPAYGAGIDVAIENVDGKIFHVGDTVKATVRVTNTGSTVLNVTGYTMVDGNGNDRSDEGTTEWNYSSEPADARALEPGKHYFVDYYITATEADGGLISRKFTATAIDNVGNAVSDTDETTLFMQSYTTPDTTTTLTPLVPDNDPTNNYTYTSLSLDGVTPEYVPLYPDDTYSVTVTASNIGEHDLRGLIIEAFKEGINSEGISFETSLGTVYNGGSTTIMKVDENITADFTYTVLPEDEGQIVNLVFKAKAADTVTTELVYSNPWVCEFEVEGGEDEPVNLYLEALDYSSLVGSLGETLEVPLLTTNNGESEMVVYGSRYLDEAGNFVSTDHMDSGSENNYLYPGESQHTTYQILVTQADIDAGKIIRKVLRVGKRVVGAEDGFVAYEKDETGGDKDYETNWVDIEIPLRDSPADAMLFIEQIGPASQPDGALGETIKIPLRETNVGDMPVYPYGFTSRDGDDVFKFYDWAENFAPKQHYLAKDESNDFEYQIYVTEGDVDAGVIKRTFWIYYYPYVVTPTGEYADASRESTTNKLDFEFPLRDVPDDGTGELLLETTDVSKPDASVGEWVTATLKLTNIGDVNVFANNSCDWNPEDGWLLNSAFVSGVTGGTGSPSPLQPGLYVTYDLSIYVTQKDVDAGQIERKIYFYGLKEGTEQNVYSNTEKITIRLRPTDKEDDDSYIDLELVPETMTPVFAEVGDVLDAPLTLINHGNAPATGKSLFYWYEDSSLANDDSIDVGPNYFWLDANGGEDHQTYHAKVTPDDIAKGVVIRKVKEGACRIIETDDGGHSDGIIVDSNEATIEIPLMIESTLIPPVTITVAPDLVLTMKQLTPPQAVYKDGQEIEYEWTLTNVGDADCDFAGLKLYYTNQAGNMITAEETFFGLDGREVLKANGGSKTDKGKITLDAANILSDDMIVVAFYGQGYYPNTTEVWVKSNTVQFEYRIDDNIWTPEPVEVMLDKWEDSIRPYSKGYANGSDVWYGWSVSIPEDAVLYNFTLEDPMYDDHHGGHIVFIDGAFGYESNAALGYYYHTVTYPEAEAGSLTNTITASWDDPVTGERVFTSDSVTVPTFTFPPNPPVPPVYPPVEPPLPPEITHTPGTLDIHKEETSHPKNDSFYQENELITYDIIVYNNSDETMYDIIVDDPLVIGINKMIGYLASLPPHGSYAFTFCYIVTDKDCDAGSVTNTATASWTDAGGHGHSNTSNPVTSLTGWPDKTGGLVLTKVETSKPANGSYYTEGETIGYKIIATNNSKRVLTDVEIYDLLSDLGMTPIGTAELLHPTEARTFIFSHIVTAEDVKRGFVENYAVGYYTDDKTYGNYTESNHVISDTDGQPDYIITTAEGFNPLPVSDDFCKLTLNGKGNGTADYTQHICTQHLPVAQQVDALVNAASDKGARTMAWKTARALWTAQIDAMYDILFDAAKDLPTKLIVLNEKMMFNADAACYEEELAKRYPNDEDVVAQKLAEMMMTKSVELCYVLHTAPADRLDSYLGSHAALADAAESEACARAILERTAADTRYIETLCKEHAPIDRKVLDQIQTALTLQPAQRTEALTGIWSQARKLWLAQLDAGVNERYRAADNDGRKLIAASRTTFGNWLHTYEELLTLLYPEHEVTVNEVVARTVMNRTVDECVDANAR